MIVFDVCCKVILLFDDFLLFSGELNRQFIDCGAEIVFCEDYILDKILLAVKKAPKVKVKSNKIIF